MDRARAGMSDDGFAAAANARLLAANRVAIIWQCRGRQVHPSPAPWEESAE